MDSFTGYADFFSDRYNRSLDAAGLQQRQREDEASRRFVDKFKLI